MTVNNRPNRFPINRRSLLGLTGGALLAGCLNGGPGGTTTQPTPNGGEPAGKQIFVGPDGSDSNPGTESEPLGTLEAARDAIRAMKEDGGLPAEGVAVELLEGEYRRTAPLQLRAEDSGTENKQIRYRAYQDGDVTFTGGATIQPDAFEGVSDQAVLDRIPSEAESSVMQVDLAGQGIEEYGEIQFAGFGLPSKTPSPEVFYAGETLQMARWPDEGWLKIPPDQVVSAPIPRFGEDPDSEPTKWHYDDERIEEWQNIDDVWVYGYWGNAWASQNMRIDSINASENTITAAQYSHYGIRPNNQDAGRYYYFNALEALNRPGEYYLDREKGILYFIPPDDGDNPLRISTSGASFFTGRDVSNVTIRGLSFELTRADGVNFNGGKHNRIESCTFEKIGEKGVRFRDGENASVAAGDNHVIGCDFLDMGKGGVAVSAGDRQTLTPGDSSIVNNYAENYDRAGTYNPAGRISGVANTIANNYFKDGRHQAISFAGNNHVIENNHLDHVVYNSSDAGAIYTARSFSDWGNQIRNNFIHDVWSGNVEKSEAGIYLDDQFSGTTVTGNVLVNCDLAFLMGGGRSTSVTNNLVMFSDRWMQFDQRGLNWRSEQCKPGADSTLMDSLDRVPYQEAPWSEEYPQLTDILDDEPCIPKHNTVTHNVALHSPGESFGSEVSEYGTVENNLKTTEALGFAGDGLSFSFSEDSLVASELPEWDPIDVDAIGLRQNDSLPTRMDTGPLSDRVTPFAGLSVAIEGEVVTGDATPLAVTAYGYDGSELEPDTIEYRVEDDGIVTVSNDGALTGEAVGSTRVWVEATIEDKTVERFIEATVQSGPSNIEGFNTHASTKASFASSNSTYTIEANGADVWSYADEYGAIYKQDALGESGSVEVKISDLEQVSDNTKGGLMVRNDISGAGDAIGYLVVNVTYQDGWLPQVTYDSNEDGMIDDWANGDDKYDSGPIWLRLERDGSAFRGYYRQASGDSWTEITSDGPIEIASVESDLDVGMWVCAHDESNTATFSFENFSVS